MSGPVQIRAALYAAIDRRAAEMFAEDAPVGLAAGGLAGSLRDEYRRLAEAELTAESRESAQ